MADLLVGDVGGTNARFALAEMRDGAPTLHAMRKLTCADFPDFNTALRTYLDDLGAGPRHALFALAGPVSQGAVRLLNRPDWPIVDSRALEQRFGFTRVRLVNDFAGMARSVPELPQSAFLSIWAGRAPGERQPIIVTGPGTGFGVATIVPEGGGWRVISGEGGHSAYTPSTRLEFEICEALRGFGHVHISNELVLSGAGFDDVHRAVCQVHGAPFTLLSPQRVLEKAEAGDPICLDICRIRARGVLGAAGDLALINGARGGVVIAGGVSDHLQNYLNTDDARARFLDRGLRAQYMAGISIKLLLEERAPLIGAAALFFGEDGVT